MVEEIATVVACDKTGVWLTTTPAGSCHSCHVSSDCGTGVVAKTFTPKQNRFFVKTNLPLLAGEQVQIGIVEQGLVLAALMVYFVTLVLMMLILVLAQWLWHPAEGWLMILGAFAMAMGFWLARVYNNQIQRQHEQVSILRVLPQISIKQATS